MSTAVNVRVEKSEQAKELERFLGISWDLYQHHPNDAGFDVRACIKEPILIPTLGISVIPTGLFIEMLNPYYEIQCRPRSGLATKGITILNAPGTIDYGYRDEIKVILGNLNTSDFLVNAGERIGQLCFRPIPEVRFEYVEKINRKVDRGGGFGSSGEK